MVDIHQMTNTLSPLRVWPLTPLINGNSGSERPLLFLSFLDWRADLPFPFTASAGMYSIALLSTF